MANLNKEQTKQKIHKLVRRNTIRAFECCAGHHQSFFTDVKDGTILKRNSSRKEETTEGDVMTSMMDQNISCVIPRFMGLVNLEQVEFIKMEDLTRNCQSPAIMDVKLGSRTFLFTEANNALRDDLFHKMVKVDENAPDEHERARGSITKYRYLDFRDHRSTSKRLGFRIEGIRLCSGETLDKCVINRIGDEDAFLQFLRIFVKESPLNLAETYATLRSKVAFIRSVVLSSPFFAQHAFIGTSLLFILDVEVIDVKLIDFAKVRSIPKEQKTITSECDESINGSWQRGIDNVLRILLQLENQKDFCTGP
jgi:1D-myo-inositol-triphosphate 3-kinase